MMPALRNLSNVGAGFRAADSKELQAVRVTGFEAGVTRQLHQQQQQLFHPGSGQRADAGEAQQSQAFRRAQLSQRQQEVFEKPVYPIQARRESAVQSCYSGGSSGSEHEPSSEYLEALVSGFMEVEERGAGSSAFRGVALQTEDDDESSCSMSDIKSSIEALSSPTSALEYKVYTEVMAALEMALREAGSMTVQERGQAGGATLRRAVMAQLRALGYNAAVCKSRWDHSRGFPGGDHEYIDVVFASDLSPAPKERIVVDIDFRAQFQVARPTPQFKAAFDAAPAVFVGRVDRLQQLVELLSDACRRSLRIQGMHLPPWRKVEYLRAKWLAPYKRTTNLVPATASAAHLLVKSSPPQPKADVRGACTVMPAFFVPKAYGPALCSASSGGAGPAFRSEKRAGMAAPRGVLGMLLQEHTAVQQQMPMTLLSAS